MGRVGQHFNDGFQDQGIPLLQGQLSNLTYPAAVSGHNQELCQHVSFCSSFWLRGPLIEKYFAVGAWTLSAATAWNILLGERLNEDDQHAGVPRKLESPIMSAPF